MVPEPRGKPTTSTPTPRLAPLPDLGQRRDKWTSTETDGPMDHPLMALHLPASSNTRFPEKIFSCQQKATKDRSRFLGRPLCAEAVCDSSEGTYLLTMATQTCTPLGHPQQGPLVANKPSVKGKRGAKSYRHKVSPSVQAQLKLNPALHLFFPQG